MVGRFFELLGAASMGFHLAPKYLELDPYLLLRTTINCMMCPKAEIQTDGRPILNAAWCTTCLREITALGSTFVCRETVSVALKLECLDHLRRYSGDFGVGFYGHVQLAASVYTIHPLHGPLCYLCDATSSHTDGGATTIVPRDSIHRRVFIEPYGVLVEVVAGTLSSVTVDSSARTFSLQVRQRPLWLWFVCSILSYETDRIIYQDRLGTNHETDCVRSLRS